MTDIEVWLSRQRGDRGDLRVGTAHVTRVRGRLSTTFLYSPDYLAAGGRGIDPALALDPGAQYVPGLPRAFLDTAPDRWGRNLIDKAERLRARDEGRVSRSLDDLDYLLGVSDDTRQGALRFRAAGSSDFAGPPAEVPPLLALPALLRASERVLGEDDAAGALKQLLDTGTTGLGGARPKASVVLEDGGLALAKFPHQGDRWDVMGWEAVAIDLLRAAGVRAPEARLVPVGSVSALVLRRFDRDGGGRIPYFSAMTALEASDGQSRDYVELAQAVRDLSAEPRADLRELYRRVAASVALGNTDDHLRNHGFVGARGGWRLSPAFDVNPNPVLGARRATSVAGADAFPEEVEGLAALAEDCDLSASEAAGVVREVSDAVADWASAARRRGLAAREAALMGEAIGPRLEALVRRFG